MATVKKFEDLEVWKRSRELCNRIYGVSKRGEFSRDYPLRNEVRKTAISVMSNIAEGFERNGNAEFAQFLSISKGSGGELESLLYVALDQAYLTQREFETLQEAIRTIRRMLGGLMGYLRRCGMRGSKYRTAHDKPGTRNS